MEDAPLKFLWDAATGVGDTNQELFRLRHNRNPHRTGRTIVLDGVLRKVKEQSIDQRIAASHEAIAIPF